MTALEEEGCIANNGDENDIQQVPEKVGDNEREMELLKFQRNNWKRAYEQSTYAYAALRKKYHKLKKENNLLRKKMEGVDFEKISNNDISSGTMAFLKVKSALQALVSEAQDLSSTSSVAKTEQFCEEDNMHRTEGENRTEKALSDMSLHESDSGCFIDAIYLRSSLPKAYN